MFALYGPITTYEKLQIAHAPGMPGTFFPPPRASDLGMHHGMCVMHVSWCMPKSLSSGFIWSQWRGTRSRHSRRMRNPQLYVCGKRPMYIPRLPRLDLARMVLFIILICSFRGWEVKLNNYISHGALLCKATYSVPGAWPIFRWISRFYFH